MKIKRIKRLARKALRRKPGLKRQSKSALLKDCKRKSGLKRQSKSALLKDCKRKPGLKQQSKSVLLKDCKRVSWTVLKEIARIRKSFKLMKFMIFGISCSILMELDQNLHDLSGLQQFAIDPG